MAGFPEILFLLLALFAALASLALVMYIMYRLGLYVMLHFGVHKPGVAKKSE